MDINYFLFCRNNYDKIIDYLNNIIDTMEDISEYTREINNSEILFDIEVNMLSLIEKRKNIISLKESCVEHIYSLCNHEFINDLIDINPDESQTICYCQICDLSK